MTRRGCAAPFFILFELDQMSHICMSRGKREEVLESVCGMKHVGGPLWNERWLWRRDCSILIDNDHRAIKTCTIFAHSIKDVCIFFIFYFIFFILHFVRIIEERLYLGISFVFDHKRKCLKLLKIIQFENKFQGLKLSTNFHA